MAQSSTVRHRLSAAPSSSSSSSSASLPLFSFRNKSFVLPLKPLSSISFLSFSPSPSLPPSVRVSTAPLEYAPAPESEFEKEIRRLEILRSRLSDSPDLEARLRVLNAESRVRKFFETSRFFSSHGMGPYEMFLLKCLVAAGQEHVLEGVYGVLIGQGGGGVTELRKLTRLLDEVERFYDCFGGVIG
ncbi:hypothetical protein ACLOJK_023424 [Asimina triloba]